MVGHGGNSASSYLTDPTSPIPSHCASIVATSTWRVNICKSSTWEIVDQWPSLKPLTSSTDHYPGIITEGWMDERCFRPLLCTVKAELGRGQPGLMRWIWDETLPQSSIDRSTFYSAAHRATKWASGRPHHWRLVKLDWNENQWS